MKGALLVLRVVADVNFFNETYYIMTSCGKYISMLLLTVHCQILINYKDLSPVLSVLQRHFKIPFFIFIRHKCPFRFEKHFVLLIPFGLLGTKLVLCFFQLPGRTDNEIKNYWNTRLKRHQRAGLPIYPEYLLSRVPDQDMNCHTPDESRGKKRSNELPQEKVVGMDDLVGDFMVFQHLDYGKDPVVPANPLKRHASTGDLSCVQIPANIEKTFYSNDLNYVLTKSQSMPLGSAIANGYPTFDGNLSTSGTIHGSMKTELPSFQCSKYDFSNGWLLQCPSASIEQQIDTFIQSPESMTSHNNGMLGTIINKGDVLDDPTKSVRVFEMPVPLGCNIVSQSNDYPMWHPSSSVNGDCEPDACLFTEIQDSNSPSGGSDAIFTLGKSYPDAIFSVAGMPGTSLEASFLNDDSLLLKDQSYFYPSGSFFDEDSCEERKPLIDAGQWFDSSAWKSVPGACNKPDFPGP